MGWSSHPKRMRYVKGVANAHRDRDTFWSRDGRDSVIERLEWQTSSPNMLNANEWYDMIWMAQWVERDWQAQSGCGLHIRLSVSFRPSSIDVTCESQVDTSRRVSSESQRVRCALQDETKMCQKWCFPNFTEQMQLQYCPTNVNCTFVLIQMKCYYVVFICSLTLSFLSIFY